jgi:hypothetical protein
MVCKRRSHVPVPWRPFTGEQLSGFLLGAQRWQLRGYRIRDPGDVELSWRTGEFGLVEAYTTKKQEMADWLADADAHVRAFAESYVRGLDRRIAAEQRLKRGKHRNAEAHVRRSRRRRRRVMGISLHGSHPANCGSGRMSITIKFRLLSINQSSRVNC